MQECVELYHHFALMLSLVLKPGGIQLCLSPVLCCLTSEIVSEDLHYALENTDHLLLRAFKTRGSKSHKYSQHKWTLLTTQLTNGMMHQGRQSAILNAMTFKTRGPCVLTRHWVVITAPLHISEVTNSISLRGQIIWPRLFVFWRECCVTVLVIRYYHAPAHRSHSAIHN
jgi:hypothetical protein